MQAVTLETLGCHRGEARKVVRFQTVGEGEGEGGGGGEEGGGWRGAPKIPNLFGRRLAVLRSARPVA